MITLSKEKCESWYPSSSCGTIQSNTLTNEEIYDLLEIHNNKRAFVASGSEMRGTTGPQPAGIIQPLQWDYELAKIAQRWADQCRFGHDHCRDVDRFPVGQNVAKMMHSAGYTIKLSDLVQLWYDEVQDFDGQSVYNFRWQSYPQIGHYSQLVWGETTHVGCAAIRYMGYDAWYTTYLVCNYGPSGNWIGRPVYYTY
ncbi:venom allergen 3-like [Microplitis demolitor]|uniref:venom allergen 3-like n=1 Tax=Microplitis demolitor TaxID=69319 RepID=UPI0004CD74DB|nr:venom allergen 3-like [Microplitis demolitor]